MMFETIVSGVVFGISAGVSAIVAISLLKLLPRSQKNPADDATELLRERNYLTKRTHILLEQVVQQLTRIADERLGDG